MSGPGFIIPPIVVYLIYAVTLNWLGIDARSPLCGSKSYNDRMAVGAAVTLAEIENNTGGSNPMTKPIAMEPINSQTIMDQMRIDGSKGENKTEEVPWYLQPKEDVYGKVEDNYGGGFSTSTDLPPCPKYGE